MTNGLPRLLSCVLALVLSSCTSAFPHDQGDGSVSPARAEATRTGIVLTGKADFDFEVDLRTTVRSSDAESVVVLLPPLTRTFEDENYTHRCREDFSFFPFKPKISKDPGGYRRLVWRRARAGLDSIAIGRTITGHVTVRLDELSDAKRFFSPHFDVYTSSTPTILVDSTTIAVADSILSSVAACDTSSWLTCMQAFMAWTKANVRYVDGAELIGGVRCDSADCDGIVNIVSALARTRRIPVAISVAVVLPGIVTGDGLLQKVAGPDLHVIASVPHPVKEDWTHFDPTNYETGILPMYVALNRLSDFNYARTRAIAYPVGAAKIAGIEDKLLDGRRWNFKSGLKAGRHVPICVGGLADTTFVREIRPRY